MKTIRWSDNDRYWGPFTYSRDRRYCPFTIMLGSGHDEYRGARVRLSAFGHTLIVALPQWVLEPHRRKVVPGWDAETTARLGRDWYWDEHEREFGFTIVEGAIHVHYGPQTHSSDTTKSKIWWIPWKSWRLVRHSLYDQHGEHWVDQPVHRGRKHRERIGNRAWMNIWEAQRALEAACPTIQFEFDDFDGERITATTKIEEREWKRGEGWWRWLSLASHRRVSRSLDLRFNSEVGRRKGSWKGGTLGHGITMRPGELHEDAFRRYCDENKLTFVGRVEPEPTALEAHIAKGATDGR